MLIYFRQPVNFNKMQFMTFSSVRLIYVESTYSKCKRNSKCVCKFYVAYGTYMIHQIIAIMLAELLHIWFFFLFDHTIS